MHAAMETAKGSIILAARQSLELTLPETEFQRVLACMPAASRELLDSDSLVPSGRYPMERVAEMLAALARHWGPARIPRLEELGSFIAVKQLSGVLKFLVRIGTVGATVAMLPKAWELFFQGSSARLVDRSANRFQGVVTSAFAGELLNAAVRGFIREVVGQAGGRHVDVKDLPARAPNEHHVEVRWQ
jgi:hypothetical protein